MQDSNHFHQVFKPEWGSPYTQDFLREIDVYRKSLNGVLFIDRVLRSVGVTKGKSSNRSSSYQTPDLTICNL